MWGLGLRRGVVSGSQTMSTPNPLAGGSMVIPSLELAVPPTHRGSRDLVKSLSHKPRVHDLRYGVGLLLTSLFSSSLVASLYPMASLDGKHYRHIIQRIPLGLSLILCPWSLLADLTMFPALMFILNKAFVYWSLFIVLIWRCFWEGPPAWGS